MNLISFPRIIAFRILLDSLCATFSYVPCTVNHISFLDSHLSSPWIYFPSLPTELSHNLGPLPRTVCTHLFLFPLLSKVSVFTFDPHLECLSSPVSGHPNPAYLLFHMLLLATFPRPLVRNPFFLLEIHVEFYLDVLMFSIQNLHNRVIFCTRLLLPEGPSVCFIHFCISHSAKLSAFL